MQYLLLQDMDASQGGITAPGVVVSEAQTTSTKLVFLHVSFF